MIKIIEFNYGFYYIIFTFYNETNNYFFNEICERVKVNKFNISDLIKKYKFLTFSSNFRFRKKQDCKLFIKDFYLKQYFFNKGE